MAADNETSSLLLFSSKVEIDPSEVNPLPARDDRKNQVNQVNQVDQKKQIEGDNEACSQENKVPHKITIETRDAIIKTDATTLLKFRKSKEGEQPSLWLDFRSSEVNDFLDVISGRKTHLRHFEHVESIAKIMKIDLRILDNEYNKIVDIIKESIIVEIYKLFPAGKITKYNSSLILTTSNCYNFSNYFPGISLKSTISKDIREQYQNYTKYIRNCIWKKVNGMSIPLKPNNGKSIDVNLMVDCDFNEYWLIYKAK